MGFTGSDPATGGCSNTRPFADSATFPGHKGLLISWWFSDDPMFGETGFGGRGKGEGNKTCLPWISAVSVHAFEEMIAQYGTTDIAAIRDAKGGCLQRMRRRRNMV